MRQKFLLIDLLYADGGSLDEDMKAIANALAVDQDIEYLRVYAHAGWSSVPKVYYQVLFHHYDKVIFLSSKISQLLMFIPLRLSVKCYAIYHFMPKHRQKFHGCALSVLSYFFVFGVYASGVADKIKNFIGFRPMILPSRIIDRERSLALLRQKLAKNQACILVPGVRPGVRKPVALAPIKEKLTNNLGFDIEGIYIQGGASFENQKLEITHEIGNLSQEEYEQVYCSSLIVAVDFDETYEVRASGVILDALRNGCLLLSNDHPIVRQYGFPTSVITDLEHLDDVLLIIKNASIEVALELIPGVNFDDFRKKWSYFLN